MTAPEDGPDAQQPRTLAARVRDLASLVAPTTVITALLIYFGAVYTDGRLAYYGIQLGLADLGNQDLVLYGTEAIYAPVALLLTTILVALGIHATVLGLLSSSQHATAGILVTAALVLAGVLATARAVIGMLVPGVYVSEAPGLTPVAMALGTSMLAYAGWITGRLPSSHPVGRLLRWYNGEQTLPVRRAAAVAVAALTLSGLFWGTNRFAFALGLNRSYEEAIDGSAAYRVVLDTREPLVDLPDGVAEIELTTEPERNFRYRYHGLRLVLESGGRLFLVPEQWTRNSRTLVVPYDATVRVQLTPPPKNLAPG